MYNKKVICLLVGWTASRTPTSTSKRNTTKIGDKMYTGFRPNIALQQPSDAELATQALSEEATYRFPYFSAGEAVTLGLSLRKRFRSSTRHAKGKGLVISIQTISGHTLFACTVGDLGGVSGVGDVSLVDCYVPHIYFSSRLTPCF